MANPYTKFEVCSLGRSGYISQGEKLQNGSPDPYLAPFREDFSWAGWDLL